jgi:tyrosine-protein kinase Etk/Wzc
MNQNISKINIQPRPGINFKKYLFHLLKHWYFIVGAVVIAIFAAFMINRYQDTLYLAQVSVIIDDKENVQNIFEKVYASAYSQRPVIQNEQTVLKSYTLARRTLEKMQLEVQYFSIGRLRTTQIYRDVDINVNVDPANLHKGKLFMEILPGNQYRLYDEKQEYIDTLLHFGQQFRHQGYAFNITLNNSKATGRKYCFVINDYNELANQFKNQLQIKLDNQYGSVLVLSIRGSNKDLIVDYLNTLSNEYIHYSLEKKIDITQRTLTYIQEQKDNMVDSLNRIEAQLFALKFKQDKLTIGPNGEIQLNELEKLNRKKNELNELTQNYDQYLNLLANLGTYDGLVVLSLLENRNPMLENEIQALQELVEKRDIYTSVLKKGSVGNKWMDEKIETQQGRIEQNMGTIIEYNQWVQEKIDSVLAVTQKKIFSSLNDKHYGLNIERKYDVFRTFYNILLEKEAQIGIQQSSIASDKRVLDPARSDNAVLLAPQTREIYKMAILLSLLLSIGSILSLNWLNPKITDKEDIIRNTQVPILGYIGHNESHYEVPVIEMPRSVMAESFRRVRTNLQFVLQEEGANVVMVTSTVSGEGKTFATVNLATVMALTEHKVLLIGMDLRKPKIHDIFNISNLRGMSTLLSGKTPYDEVMYPANIKNLTVAVSGPVPPNPSELIEGTAFARFMEKARKDFDYIFIDTPPLAMVTDAMLIAKHCDASVYIIRQNYSNKVVLELVNEFYSDKKMKNLNLLINDTVFTKRLGYGYGYDKQYYSEDSVKA